VFDLFNVESVGGNAVTEEGVEPTAEPGFGRVHAKVSEWVRVRYNV